MAYLDLDSFTFDGKSSKVFDLDIGWFDGDNENDLTTGLEVELQRGDMNMMRTEPNQYGAIYTNTLQFDFAIFKHCSDKSFTRDESHALNKWLRGSNTYKKLVFNDMDHQTVVFYAVCTNIVDAVYKGIDGKKITFICNSPFGFTPKINKKYEVTTNPIKIINYSDNGIYYPSFTIIVNSSQEELTITNQSDNNNSLAIDFSKIDVVNDKKTVNIDSNKTIVTDINGKMIPSYKLGWTIDDNNITKKIYWPRLVQGTNTISFSFSCTFIVNCEFPRKVGVA